MSSIQAQQKKQIFVVRHGHADFDTRIDFERHLTEKGQEAVKKTAVFIQNKCRELSIDVDLCISSAAMRTRQTADIICQTNQIAQCHFHKELYATEFSQWIDKISKEAAQNILIVGHNPTFSQFVRNTCGYECYMQPANCAFITLEFSPDGIIYPATLNDYYQNE